MSTTKSCPKCGRRMDNGFVIDAGHGSAPNVPFWHPGEPVKRWWGVKIKKQESRKVVTWRCGSCQYLESYAP